MRLSDDGTDPMCALTDFGCCQRFAPSCPINPLLPSARPSSFAPHGHHVTARRSGGSRGGPRFAEGGCGSGAEGCGDALAEGLGASAADSRQQMSSSRAAEQRTPPTSFTDASCFFNGRRWLLRQTRHRKKSDSKALGKFLGQENSV